MTSGLPALVATLRRLRRRHFDAVYARGWSRDETVARVDFRERFGPVDVGQGYMMDYIQTLNAGSLYDKLTGAVAGA